MAYPNQNTGLGISHGSRDHFIVSGTVKTMFNLVIDSTNKALCIVGNVVRALVRKKVLILESKEFGTINNADIHDAY